MKKLITILRSLFLTCVATLSIFSNVRAQDEITVENGSDLFTVISEVMDENGMLSTNVFVLERGGVYFMSQTLFTNDDLILRGEEGDEEVRPAFIIPKAAPDGNYVGVWFTIEGEGKTFKSTNIVFQMLTLQAMETGINVNTLIRASADNQRIILDKCIVNGAGNNVIGSESDGQYVKVTNCNIRNNRNLSDHWSGGLLYGSWSSGGWRDSLIVRNNTFINIGNVGVRGFTGETSRAVIIDHNTFFGTTRTALDAGSQSNVQITNNMIAASFTNGNWKTAGTAPDIDIWGSIVAEGNDHKGAMYRVFLIDAAAYPHVENLLGFDVSGDQESIEEQRSFVISNNCCYWPLAMVNAWDTLDIDGGKLTEMYRTDPQADWILEHIMVNDEYDNSYGHDGSPDAYTSDFDPGFDQATVERILTPMNEWLYGYRNIEGWEPYMCNIDDPGKEIQLAWPLPENLAYTNEVLKSGGTDGLPVGDLNWFPAGPSGFEDIKATTEISLSSYPNPFFDYTTITYQLTKRSPVKLTVFNMIGEVVMVLVNQFQEAGVQHIEWSGTDAAGNELPAGMYIYSFEAGTDATFSKVILSK